MTALACSNVVTTQPAKQNRNGLMISNRKTNLLTAFVVLGSTNPVADGICSLALAPGDFYEETRRSPYAGVIKVILSGAGPENIDITEQV